MSTGEYITNVNCDDRRAPWALEHQAKTLITNPDVGLVYNDSYITKDANTMWENIGTNCERYNFESFSKEAMLRGNLPHNNPMWRRTLHDTYGMFDDKYKSAGDWEFWLRCAFGGAKFRNIMIFSGYTILILMEFPLTKIILCGSRQKKRKCLRSILLSLTNRQINEINIFLPMGR